jgi:hypothetical protein
MLTKKIWLLVVVMAHDVGGCSDLMSAGRWFRNGRKWRARWFWSNGGVNDKNEIL